jgi:glycosyltransferase involved in cell wall biosynthesis
MAPPNTKPTYVIVTPARDEAQYIEDTITSVARQAITPAEWIIVDDGSTDGTSEIIDRHAALHHWITPLHVANRGHRDADIGAVGAFLEGYRALKTTRWDFLVNLDADLGLEPGYFADCFEEFRRDPTLGIGGGTLYNLTAAGALHIEVSPAFHVRGATKIYRRACWDAFGGLQDAPGWDTLDEVKAHLAGFCVRSFPGVRALHRRPTGQAGGTWRDSAKNGRSDYFLGYHPLFMIVKCLRRLFRRPYIVNGVGHFCGFLGGYLDHRPRIDDRNVIRYVRKQQLRRLICLNTTWR